MLVSFLPVKPLKRVHKLGLMDEYMNDIQTVMLELTTLSTVALVMDAAALQ